MELYKQLMIICPLAFFASLVDSIAGGGGIISLPAYYVAGISPQMALGTNKFASTCGTSFSVMRFIKNGKFHLESVAVSAFAALFGSALGARLALSLSDKILKYILIVLLPIIAVFMITNKNFRNDSFEKQLPKNRILIYSAIAGFVIGGYDGFFGPGAGTFLILVFNTVIGFDILTSSGNAKIINLSSNVAAFVTFLLSGNVVFLLGVPAAISSIIGNYVGSGLALKNGMKIIRPVFIVVLVLLLIKILFDIINI